MDIRRRPAVELVHLDHQSRHLRRALYRHLPRARAASRDPAGPEDPRREHAAAHISLPDGAVLHRDRRRVEVVPRPRPRPRADAAPVGLDELPFRLDQEQGPRDLHRGHRGRLAGLGLRDGDVPRGPSRHRRRDHEGRADRRRDDAAALPPDRHPDAAAGVPVGLHRARPHGHQVLRPRRRADVGRAGRLGLAAVELHVRVHLQAERDGRRLGERGHHADDHLRDHRALPVLRAEGEEPASGRPASSSPAGGVLVGRIVIYGMLLLFAAIYLIPLFVMLVTSFKSMDEIQSGNMLAFPKAPTLDPWLRAWGEACVGLTCAGIKGYFWNSIKMVVPAVLISTILGALNGYVLTKWRFRGATLVFGLMLFACFIPFQSVLLPMATILGSLGRFGATLRDQIGMSLGFGNPTVNLVTVHVIYGLGFTTLFFRNYYEAFPTELVRAAQVDGASFFQIFRRIMLPNSLPIIVVTVIYQFTNIWNDFLFASAYAGTGESMPMTVALNNVVNTSTGVVEYNVNMAAAMIAAMPTLLVYILAGRYFVRGLMAGAVKG